MSSKFVAIIGGLLGSIAWALGLLQGEVDYGGIHACFLGSIIFLLIHLIKLLEAPHD